MVLDEFLIAIGLKTDTKPAEELESAIDGVTDSANEADAAAQQVGQSFASSFNSALTVVGTFATAIKTTLLGVWAFLDGTVRRVEELQNAEDESIRTTQEQIEMSKRYQENMDKMGKTLEVIKTRIALAFLPTMVELSEAYANLINDNKDLIENGIKVLLDWVTKAGQVISNFLKFVDRFIGMKNALMILIGVLALVNRAMILAFITNPVTLIIAVIAGLLILIDDFMTYIDGGESEFGDFWGAMLKGIDAVSPALQKIWDMLIYGTSLVIEFGAYVVQYLGGGFIDMVELVTAALTLLLGLFTGNTSLMIEAWRGMVENFVSMFRNFAMLFQPLANGIVSVFSAMMSAIGSLLSKAYDIITYPFRQAYDWIVNAFSKLPSLIGNIISKLPGVSTVANIGNAIGGQVSRTINNIGGNTTANINVTAPNATSAANQTAAALQNTQAQRNFGGQAIA